MKKIFAVFAALLLFSACGEGATAPESEFAEVEDGFGGYTADVIQRMDAAGYDGARMIAMLEAGETPTAIQRVCAKRVQTGYDNVDGVPQFATVGGDCDWKFFSCVTASWSYLPCTPGSDSWCTQNYIYNERSYAEACCWEVLSDCQVGPTGNRVCGSYVWTDLY